jgi:hypothetical protein
MPALANPRHEAFAQAIFAGLTGKTRIERAQSTAYLEAYPSCSPGPAAWTNASRLLRRAKVWERIGELQAEANKRLEPKIDLSRERIGRRLHLASQMAEQDRNPNGITAAELGIAKVFHPVDAPDPNHIDFNSAQSMHDIGRKLLQSIGFKEPDDASIREAIELNDTFVDGLQAIHQRAQALMLEQG